jgi:serine/threonine protein kinase
MECCNGGDFFIYLKNRKFKLSETHAANIIHKLSTAVFYLHHFGIAHRDLKPENILMTDTTDNADIRIMDFGLSKIIGPNETCNEPYGTLVINNFY